MSVTKKHLTSLNVVSPDDGLYAQQVNYGLGTTIKSLADVTARHFEDYNAKFNEDKVFDGFVVSYNSIHSVDVSAGNATVKGIWLLSTGTINVTIPTTPSDTYYVVLQSYGDGGTIETRNPLNDTVTLEAVLEANFSGTLMHPIAKVTTDGASVISAGSVTDYGALFTRRMDSIKPSAGSKITVYTGTHPNATQEVFMFSGSSVLNRNDNGGLWGGATDDHRLYNNGTDNILDIINDDFQIDFAGTPKYTFTSSMMGLTGGLIVSGTTNMIGAVSVSGSVLIDDSLEVTGALAVSGAMTFDDNLFVVGTFQASGASIFSTTLTASGAVGFSGTLDVIGASGFSGAMIVDDTFDATGNSTIGGTLDVTGISTALGQFVASGVSQHQGVATFVDDIIVGGEIQGVSLISGTNIFGSQLSGTSLSISTTSLLVGNITNSALTASRLMASNGSKVIQSTTLGAWVTGTINQVLVASGAGGDITLTAPQDLHTSASPTFTTVNITGSLDLTTSSLIFGSSDEAVINYSTDLLINPQSVGSGDLKLVAGDFNMNSLNIINAYSSYISGINEQTVNPPSDSGIVHKAFDGETSVAWEAIATAAADGSFTNPFIVYADSAGGLALNFYTFRITVDNPTHGTASSSTFTVRWYYSLDGGSNWVVGGSHAGISGGSGSVNFSSLTTDIDGSAITGDLKVRITLERTGGSDSLDIGTWTVSIGQRLNLPA